MTVTPRPKRRGRRPSRRLGDVDPDLTDMLVADQDIEAELRGIGLATTSNLYSIRRRE